MRNPFFLVISTILLTGYSLPVEKICSATELLSTFYREDKSHFVYTDYAKMTLAEVDAYADGYIPPHQVYNFYQTQEIKSKLDADSKDMSKNMLGIYWAMVRYYAGASTFIGGNPTQALIYANYIYAMNKYLGCLAHEYVYNRLNKKDAAKNWYLQSLSVIPQEGMGWEVIQYNNNVHNDIQVRGNFNNWKPQYMYEEKGRTYLRKVMVAKCATCRYEVLIDYKDNKLPTSQEATNRIY
ncbi:MAG: hypothetical protein J0I09_12790 [Sphingobacteriia bacterium]|nr:hypothetical protein [Sphingobacteriia bacterium]